ncbi:NOP protein chaperone 1-like [Portunus trituberculatus]|uniref:Uncharacterized protein n=1 Tax=Portunus trituberculatus TaxID=210409 RepID=A0A5B7D7G6_PORTR|nr:NOP protein chaperone 1-like [Portunus trituberculatus]MPC17126.1 uncharacterized protein [Portunus trituberculatus]
MAAPVNTSSELLAVTGDGSSRSVVENLLRQPSSRPQTEKPKTFKVARSPLLDQLQAFLPEFQRSTDQLLTQPQQQLNDLNIENTKEDDKVIEMNLLVGQQESNDSEDEEHGEASSGEDSTDSDSEDNMLHPKNLQLPSTTRNHQQNLIQVLSECAEEEERSDGEMTVASSSSGER